MKLTRAIEILNDLLTDGPYWPEEDRRVAVKLGVEALKRIDHCRRWTDSTWGSILPGETPEDTPE